MTANSTERKNIQAIVDLERKMLGQRSRLDRVTDSITKAASSAAFVAVHLTVFALWIGINSSRRASFDPFPYNLLTLAVSLEAIILTGFVLMSQNRMTQQADRRAHLDLQINLLAEQELTAILTMLSLLGDHAGIDLGHGDPRLEQLRKHTDVRTLASALDDELTTVGTPSDGTAPAGATT